MIAASTHHYLIRYQAVLLLALLLGACAGSPSAPPPAVVIPPSPSTAPQPTAAPATLAPTAVPAPAEPPAPTAIPQPSIPAAPTLSPPVANGAPLLPAPLYFLEHGQIWRLERDAVTKYQVTFEPVPIWSFDIAPATNALVYNIGERQTAMSIILDDGGRTELIHGYMDLPRIAPSGDEVAFRLDRPAPGLPVTGVYRQPRAGGRPSLLIADDPDPEPQSPADAWGYSPLVWSPDGTRLLLLKRNLHNPTLRLAIWSVANGAVIPVEEACCMAAWSADGTAIVVGDGNDWEFSFPKLWRVDSGTGASQLLHEGVYAVGPAQAADGSVLVFLSESQAVGNSNARVPMTMSRVAEDGAVTPLRLDPYELYQVLWAVDRSGAVITLSKRAHESLPALWLPSDGGQARVIPLYGSGLAWGREAAQPAPRACDHFTPLTWQPAGARTVDANVADLQRRLRAVGYTQVGSDDGLFGDWTRAAVQAFQQARGLDATGNVDCRTWQALLRAALGAS